jgi:hypothetical protein
MIGKKIRWFVGSTLVSFVVFASIAWTIQPLVTKLTDQRLTACEGQSVIAEGNPRDDAHPHSLTTIEREEQLWRTQNITHYCVEMISRAFAPSFTTVALVQNGEVNRDVSNCFDTVEGFTGELTYFCRGQFLWLEHGTDYFSIDGLFDEMQTKVDLPDLVLEAVFHPTYHFPVFVSLNNPTMLDAYSSVEVIAFVPSQN